MAELNGAELIAAERKRQVEREGWTAAHDDEHVDGELSVAALCYTRSALRQVRGLTCLAREQSDEWPWDRGWWKPSDDPVGNLVKAGALIEAEIDRLQRKAERNG